MRQEILPSALHMTKTKYTAFRCPEDLLAKAQIKSRQDRRSLSNYLVLLIEKDTFDVQAPVKAAKVVKAKAPAAKALKAKKSSKK